MISSKAPTNRRTSGEVACNDVWKATAAFLTAHEVERLSLSDHHMRQVLERVFVSNPLEGGSYLRVLACCQPLRQGNGWGTNAWLMHPRRLVQALVAFELEHNPSGGHVEIAYPSVRFAIRFYLFPEYRKMIWTEWVNGGLSYSNDERELPLRDHEVLPAIDAVLLEREPRENKAYFIGISNWSTNTSQRLNDLVSRGALIKDKGQNGFIGYIVCSPGTQYYSP